MELRDELQKTFGDSYTIERELGGGGMSRVFLAVEQSLGRPVVVKVLPNETAKRLTRRCVAADPVHPFSHVIDAWQHYFARKWNEAVMRSERVSELDPHYSEAYRVRAYALASGARRSAIRGPASSGRRARVGDAQAGRAASVVRAIRSENDPCRE